MSTSTVKISTAAPLRVVDAAGTPLATPGAGEWAVVAGGGVVRLVPPETDPATAEPAPAPLPEAVLRRPTRVVTAAAPLPRPGRSALVALALAVAMGTSTITLHRRRRA